MPFFTARELILTSRKGYIPKHPYRIETPAYISFSGGRTSGYLLYHLLQEFNGKLPDDVHVLFANTGREVEETLKFVHQCEKQWKVKIHWLEYCRTDGPIFTPGTEHYTTPGIGCQGTKEVTYKTASRNGEPFEIMIDVESDYKRAKGEDPVLPNVAQRWCSARLKAESMDRWMFEQGYEWFNCAVGIRADEPNRIRKLMANEKESKSFCCPLNAAVVTIDEVMEFWSKQPFDLGLKHDPRLGTYEGNCDACFLKRVSKIERIIKERPEILDWWVRMEAKVPGCVFSRNRPSFTEMKEKLDRKIELKLCSVSGSGSDEDADVCNCHD